MYQVGEKNWKKKKREKKGNTPTLPFFSLFSNTSFFQNSGNGLSKRDKRKKIYIFLFT
jgi:hypothetical protein